MDLFCNKIPGWLFFGLRWSIFILLMPADSGTSRIYPLSPPAPKESDVASL